MQKKYYSQEKLRDYIENLSTDKLFSFAKEIKESYNIKNKLRAVIEISNYCHNNCLYCGMRKDNKKLKRFSLHTSEILKIAQKIYNDGIDTIMFQSGELKGLYNEELVGIIERIKKEYQMRIIICSGIISENELLSLKNAGVDMYLLKIEIANPDLFEEFRPNTKYSERIEFLKLLQKYNFEISTGLILGTPKQDINDLIKGIETIIDINPNAVSVSPFISSESTPLKNHENGDYNLTLRMISLLRIIFPIADIPAVSALNIINENGQREALIYGANIITVNYSKKDNEYPLYNSKRKIVNIDYAKEIILN